MIHDDDQLWWLFCGVAEGGHVLILGPMTEHGADKEAGIANCEHNHAKFSASIRQMAAKLPAGVLQTGAYVEIGENEFTRRTLIQPPALMEVCMDFCSHWATTLSDQPYQRIAERIVELSRCFHEARELISLNT